MGPKRKHNTVLSSPSKTKAQKINEKYKGKRMSPSKRERVRRALCSSKLDEETIQLTAPASFSAPNQPPEPQSFDKVKCLTINNAVVKGYHVFKIKPPTTNPPTQLIVDREYSNKYDSNACLVWLPELKEFPKNMHFEFTDVKRQLQLQDIAGLPIGHVPKCLAGNFRNVLDANGSIFCIVTGEPVPSYPPWPASSEEGGGVVLPCRYVIYHKDIENEYNNILKLLKSIPEGNCLSIHC